MLEMASQGAKVLQTRSVAMAMKHRVRVQVLSSFDDRPGTLVVDEDEIVEQELVSGIAYSRDEAKVTLTRVADRPGVASAIFGPLAAAEINTRRCRDRHNLHGDEGGPGQDGGAARAEAR
jgi:aspartate kinase